MFLPWLLIVLGVIFLLENLNLLPWLNWSVVWPVILILAGLYMMKKRGGVDCCNWFKNDQQDKK